MLPFNNPLIIRFTIKAAETITPIPKDAYVIADLAFEIRLGLPEEVMNVKPATTITITQIIPAHINAVLNAF